MAKSTKIKFNGEECSIYRLSKLSGIPEWTISRRLKRGLSVEESLFNRRKYNALKPSNLTIVNFNNKNITLKKLAKLSKIHVETLRRRFSKNQIIEEILYCRIKLKTKKQKKIYREKLSYFNGGTKSKCLEYGSWRSMITRCRNPKHTSYHNYGARGITVCERWMEFENFVQDMGKRPSSDYSIERKKNNLGYCPENCYWATMKTQSNNTRSNRNITYKGETKTVQEWADYLGWSRHTLNHRLKRWNMDQVFETPVNEKMQRSFR